MRAHIYNLLTGEIIRTVSCSDDQMSNQRIVGESYIPSDIGNDSTHYVLNGAVTAKPDNTAVIDKATAAVGEPVTVSLVPNPSTVTIEGQSYPPVIDGSAELTFDTPGEYSITVAGFPYLDATFTVTIK